MEQFPGPLRTDYWLEVRVSGTLSSICKSYPRQVYMRKKIEEERTSLM